MGIALLITFLFFVLFWLVFFKYKWLKFSIAWGFVILFFLLHLFLIIVVGMRFVTPYSTNVTVVQHTIQLIPRLPEPTLLTAVLVKPDIPVKKGQPLFQLDRRPYEYKVRQLEAERQAASARARASRYKIEQLRAQLAAAERDVAIYKADLNAAEQKVVKAQSELTYAKFQEHRAVGLAKQGAGPEEEAQKWTAQMNSDEAALKEATAETERARLRYQTNISGVNVTVARARAELNESEAVLRQALATVESTQAQLDLARYYLKNTTMVAPANGHIVNLQVQPGMVAGIFRIGGIASFIVDSNRYLLATYDQQELKYIKLGQPVEIALNLYPGQIFRGRVGAIWWANGEGQFLPNDRLPRFSPIDRNQPQGQFAVKIYLEHPARVGLPIGAQGAAAIYASNGGFAVLRKIAIRAHSWLNWLYPMPF